MKYARWLSFAVGMGLVIGPFPARAGELLICAFDNDQDLKLTLEGEMGADVKLDAEMKHKNKPALNIMVNWTKAWDSMIIELKPVELARAPEAVSLAFKGDPNLNGLIQFTIKDSKDETMRAVLCKSVTNAVWRELRAVAPWPEAIWDGGDGNRQLDPPCVLTALMIFARRPVQASIHLADLKVTLPDPPK